MKPIKSILTFAVAASFVLTACSSPTPTPAPVPTTAPVESPTEAATTEVTSEATGEATAEGTMEATGEATAEGTMEATAEMTGTMEADVTPEMTGTMEMEATPEMTGTMEMDSTPEMTGTMEMEGTSEATMEATSEMTGTEEMTGTMPMTGTESMTGTGTTSAMTATKDIVETAIDAGEFMSLTAALESAGLVETLKGEGPFTVFAPTDEAFAAVDSATLESLMEPANQAELVKILTYHVVTGTVMAADVAGMTSTMTLEGSPITITVSGGDVMINNATIVMTDVVASNGVIHVIDAVLMPPDSKAP